MTSEASPNTEARPLVRRRTGWFPFNAEQTLNLASEMGPLLVMFVVNFLFGVDAGVWSLLAATALALIVSLAVLRRPPVMPFIAGGITLGFGALTLYTHDANWIQIKVTVFNALVSLVLFIGLLRRKYFFEFVFGKTFHYTEYGWRWLTRNAAIFFLVTAIANEAVRQGFATASVPCPSHWLWLLRKPVLSGLDIWMIFKLFLVVPLTALFFFWQAWALRGHRLPQPITSKANNPPA